MSIKYNGKTIAGKYKAQIVTDSTETNKGVIRIATDAEVNTGTDNTTAVTPKKLATKADKTELNTLSEEVTDLSGRVTANEADILTKQDKLTAGTGISIENNVVSNTQTSAEWGKITGTLSSQTDLNTALNEKQDKLTFDTTPTANSTNPVTSDGIKTALDGTVKTTGNQTITGTKTFSASSLQGATLAVTNTKDGSSAIRFSTAGNLTGFLGINPSKIPVYSVTGTTINHYLVRATTGGVGSETVPVYINKTGIATAITSYSGNAATATKATQDGSGNNIVDTYATKTEISTKANTSLNNITDAGKTVIKNNALPSQTGNAKKVLTTDGTTASWENPAGGLDLATIVCMPFGIDESENKYRYLNGQVLIQEQYPAFTAKVKSWQSTKVNLFTTEQNWQAEKTASKLGQCGKFVIDDEAGTIRLPLVININGLTDLANCGMLKNESLPNITGDFNSSQMLDGDHVAHGAFAVGGSDSRSTPASSYDSSQDGFSFDASRYSSTYQDSAPVQQEAIQYPYVIVVNTGVEEAERPINNYQVNNVYSYGMSQYYKGTMNNSSWLRSAGQWNSGTVYTGIYNWLLELLANYDERVKTISNDYTVTHTATSGWSNVNKAFDGNVDTYASCGTNTDYIEITYSKPVIINGFTALGYYTAGVARACNVAIYSVSDDGVETLLANGTGASQSGTFTTGAKIANTTVSKLRFKLINSTEGTTPTKSYPTRIRELTVTFPNTTYTDYDFVVNTKEQTFRLPMVDGSENVVDYDNAQTITDYGVSYTTSKKGVLIFSCGTSSISGLKLTINGVSFTIGQGYYGSDYNHLTGNWFELNKGDVYQIDRLAGDETNTMLFAPYTSNNSLYYYVGDTLQNTDLINIARLAEELVDRTTAAQAAHAAMPSNKYIDLTLGASGTTYIAPADGYFCYICHVENATGGYVSYVTTSYGAKITCSSYGYSRGGCMVPVSKGQSIAISHERDVVNKSLKFVYAKGAE